MFCLMAVTANARPPHHIHHPAPVPHHTYTVHHSYHRSHFGDTFAGVVIGAMIGTYMVRDTYMTYNRRAQVPQNCVTLVNQNTGAVMTQCSQNADQVIYVGD